MSLEVTDECSRLMSFTQTLIGLLEIVQSAAAVTATSSVQRPCVEIDQAAARPISQ